MQDCIPLDRAYVVCQQSQRITRFIPLRLAFTYNKTDGSCLLTPENATCRTVPFMCANNTELNLYRIKLISEFKFTLHLNVITIFVASFHPSGCFLIMMATSLLTWGVSTHASRNFEFIYGSRGSQLV
jgi:hypothetical protein